MTIIQKGGKNDSISDGFYLLARKKGEPMSDLIDRQAAIDALEKVDDYGDGIAFEVLSHAQRDISLLPSAERRGRWINGNEGIWNAVILPKCSICGETFYEMNVNINGEYPYNYCPNCGARMEGKGVGE